MTLGMWLTLTLGLVVGAAVATIFDRVRWGSGILKIDRSNPDAPKYRFEVDKLENLDKRKGFLLKVENNADLSQK